jgi:hypothetical protein
MRGHTASEAFVSARVFAQPVNNREGDWGARHGPGTEGQPRTVGRLDRPLGVERFLSWQDVRNL